MKTPARISEVTIVDNMVCDGPYPPKGFVPFLEHELGNGDCFGLYWPFGKESEEPIICEVWHDSWQMNPAFSSLARFLDHAMELGESEYVEEPTLTEDKRSPAALTKTAKVDAEQGRIEDAVVRLKTAVAMLPEYGAAWSALAQQYRRLRRFDDALKAILHALVSPSFFGAVNDNLVTWFQRQDTQDAALNADPIWKHRRELCFSYGGKKENADYPILMQCIDDYEKTGDGYKAVLLFQSYSFQMEGETVSFRERYDFNRQWFKEQQNRLFTQHLGSSRDWTSVGKA